MRRPLLASLVASCAALTAAAAASGYPQWWLRQAACIRAHEGSWGTATGNGFYGAYQFLPSTWRAVGGRGMPHQASPAEQTYRAYRLWRLRGWQPWPSARRACGL